MPWVRHSTDIGSGERTFAMDWATITMFIVAFWNGIIPGFLLTCVLGAIISPIMLKVNGGNVLAGIIVLILVVSWVTMSIRMGLPTA